MSFRNALYYGDNLIILREHIRNESVDLIYLDPPFNSNRSHNVLFKDESGQEAEAQITAFEDTWHWNKTAEQTYHDLATLGSANVAGTIGALRQFIGANQMMAYLVMMAARLVELHRVLKPTGSLYLHCDPTASHYLKVILDTVFRTEQFRNEIVWKRTPFSGSSKARALQYPRSHDVLLFFTKGRTWTWNRPARPYSTEYLNRFKWDDGDGRGPYRKTLLKTYSKETFERLKEENRLIPPKKKGAGWSYKQYLSESSIGVQIDDIWTDINALNPVAQERLGYPTQKPSTLMERIIQVSSNPGDIVLDPFCGCGTTIAAAQKLGRHWIGIDITHLAIALQKYRLKDTFGLVEKKDYEVKGEPEDLSSARQLKDDDRYQFQWWALSLVKARPSGGDIGSKQGKKGKDKGIDGVITFIDDASGIPKRILVQVKGGKAKSGDIRDLRGTIDREGAAMGIFITLEQPSRDMITEAATTGFYHSPGWNKDYPKLQILTIEELLNGKGIDAPPQRQVNVTFKKAPRATGMKSGTLDLPLHDEDL